jgi:hypothetical protein
LNQRRQNESRFHSWHNLPGGGRLYWYDLPGRDHGVARYFKEVDANETTLRFWQEIRDANGRVTEVHLKFPLDSGHRKF